MTEVLKVIDPSKIVTDSVLLNILTQQGIDKNYVEFFRDYASRSLGKEHSPYAKFYRDLKSNKRFMVVSGLPMVNANGTKVEVGWLFVGQTYTSRVNQFFSQVKGTKVTLTVINDQPDGRKSGNKLTYQPQLFLNGIEQGGGSPVLLTVDPINPNYLESTLEWDYGICKRRLRIIEGSVLGSWVFTQKPNGEVGIKYNQTGDYRLRLGQFKINEDEEVIKPEDFDELALFQGGYPVTVGDSATFYPDDNEGVSSCDAYTSQQYAAADGRTWATIRGAAGTNVDNTTNLTSGMQTGSVSARFMHFYRPIVVFNTSGLPDNASISAATYSEYGGGKDSTVFAGGRNLYSAAPASFGAIVAGDFDSFDIAGADDTAYSTAIAHANYNIGDPGTINNFALNALGLAAISLVSSTPIGIRESVKEAPNIEPTWVSLKYSYIYAWSSNKGAGYKPKLVVTYTAGATAQAVGGATASIAGALTRASTFYRNIGAASLGIAGTLSKFTKTSIGGASLAIAGALSRAMLFSQAVGGATMAIAGTLSTIFHDIVEAVKTRWHFPARSYDGTRADEIEGYGTAPDEIEGYGTPKPRYKFPSDYE